MNFVQMSITGSILVLFVLLVRIVAGDKLPKSGFLLIWEIAALRLLTPFVMKLPVNIPAISTVTEKMVHQKPNSVALVTATGGLVAGTQGQAAFGRVGGILWAAGSILLLSWFLITYMKNRQRFNQSLPATGAAIENWQKQHQLRRFVQVRISDQIASPLTYGVLHPVILLPKKMQYSDAKTINYVLTHEWIHIKRFDAVAKLLFAIAVCIHWVNPLVWVLFVIANRDMELSCDALVLRHMGEDSRADYATTLIDLLAQQRKSDSYLYANFTQNAMQERIEGIMRNKKISIAAGIAVVVLTVFAMSTFAEGTGAQPRQFTNLNQYPRDTASVWDAENTNNDNTWWDNGVCQQDGTCWENGTCAQDGTCWNDGSYRGENHCRNEYNSYGNESCHRGTNHHSGRGRHGSCANNGSTMRSSRHSAYC